MSKVASLLQKGKRALRDLELLKVLQSEIKHELSNDTYKSTNGGATKIESFCYDHKELSLYSYAQMENSNLAINQLNEESESGSLGDFVMDWDSPHSKDVIMRKNCESGEEVAISALLGDETFLEVDGYPKGAEMKVCIKKAGLSSILQFDCKVIDEGQEKVDFHIQNAYYLKSPTNMDSSVYRGPMFRDLDPALQQELKQYLISRGIGKSFTNFLILHLHKKEQNQYINWLQKLEAMVTPS